MSTNKRVSFRSLRALTYTILIKAVVDAVMLISSVANADTVFMFARAADFINIVICVLCFASVTAFSKKLVYSYRTMVAVLLLECVTLLFITAELRLTIGSYMAEAATMEMITLISIAVSRLLIGLAFLFLMYGFGQFFREDEDSVSAAVTERLGVIYICCNSISAVVRSYGGDSGDVLIVSASLVFDLLCVILEVLMFRRAYNTAFLIWRKRAFAVSEGRSDKQ